MSGDLVFLAVDAVRVFCVLLLAAALLIARPRDANAQLIGLIGLCTISYIVLGRDDYSAWIAAPYQTEVGGWRPVLNLLRNLTPGLLMILLRRLFTERPGVPGPLLAAFAMQVFLDGPAQWVHLPIPRGPAETTASLLQSLFMLLALYWTVADWRDDLVEGRRRARVIVAAVLAAEVVASSLLLRVVILADSHANYDAYRAISVCELMATAVLLVLLLMGAVDGVLTPARRLKTTPTPAEPDRAALARLTALMENERLYREPGLSLKGLADRVGIPEYRLRRLIHQELGHRNFNGFLHAYRVREACEHLQDPAQRRTPILTIALSVGYQSLNTFNRGFRETVGVTPSSYRRTQAADQPIPGK